MCTRTSPAKFFEHFLNIAEAMSCIVSEDCGLWDEEDQFFYDVLNLPNDETGCGCGFAPWWD